MKQLLKLILINFLFVSAVNAEDIPKRDPYLTPEVESAIDKGLDWLVKQQKKDGSWNDSMSNPIGITSIALLAFVSNGHLPELGKYGDVVKKGVDYLLDKGLNKMTGYFGNSMYEHGFATLLISEVFGEYKRDDLQDSLEKAVKLILESQKNNPTGAWRYSPGSRDMDMSVTQCVIQALRAAREAYINVPNEAMKKAAKAVKRCSGSDGGIGYSGPGGGPATTGGGVLSLMACDEYESKETKRGLNWLLKRSGDVANNGYAAYYCVLSMYQAGGEYWERWYPKLQKKLLKLQTKRGDIPGMYGPVTNTGFSIIALSIQKGLLPLFQR